jgi:hypothetical protein
MSFHWETATASVVDTVKIARPDFASEADNPTGHVAHDERGNAVWKWSQDLAVLPFQFEAPQLSVAEDAPSPVGNVAINNVAVKKGYNPYESGLILKKGRAKKRDLKELSRWIEARKRASEESDT